MASIDFSIPLEPAVKADLEAEARLTDRTAAGSGMRSASIKIPLHLIVAA
ncbi:hypothetical protein [Aurantimonas sp. 22II-16-19i]|nr:hypothetical protein [Aurantimonas sp. 22II-16-19i]